MNWIAVILLIAIAIIGLALYQDLKKRFSEQHKNRLELVLGFGVVYIIANVLYFILLAWLWQSVEVREIRFAPTKYKFIGTILVFTFPLLLQAKVIPNLKKHGFSYKIIRLSVDLALLISIISLFLRDAISTSEFELANAYYFSGITVYFTFSKALIEWFILTEDLEENNLLKGDPKKQISSDSSQTEKAEQE